MTLYSTSAAAHRLATTRGTVQQLARAAGIGRGAGGSEQVAWLFTDQEIERMRAAMAQSG